MVNLADYDRLVTKTADVSHGKLLRCPSCRHTFEPSPDDYEIYSEIYSEGEHEVMCPECEHHFCVKVSVKYTYDNPALIEKEEDS